jgi:hypothetical protein
MTRLLIGSATSVRRYPARVRDSTTGATTKSVASTLGRVRDRAGAPVREREGSMPLWTAIVIGCEFVLLLFVGIWNAAKYPLILGYDAAEHMAYADSLLHNGSLPHGTGEFYTPPAFYALAAAGTWVGSHIGMSDPHRAVLYLNVLYIAGTATLILVLARLLFARRPVLWVASLGFFALLPIVAKDAAMFYPESLNMLVSTAGLTLGTWMLLRRRFSLRWLCVLAVVLAAGQLVRASSLFAFISVGIAFVAALATPSYRRLMPVRRLAIAFAGLVILTTPWYVHQTLTYHTQPFIARADFVHNITTFPARPGRENFFKVSVDDILHRPVKPFFTNQAVSETYVDMWGDWSGVFVWSSYSQGPWLGALKVLNDQSLIGIVPTLLAVAGWFGLLWLVVRGKVDRIPYLPILLLPAIALLAYLWKAYAELSPDGDLLGATHILVTTPAWAIAFGLAFWWLSRYRPLLIALTVLFLFYGALELRFMLYGLRDHWVLYG